MKRLEMYVKVTTLNRGYIDVPDDCSLEDALKYASRCIDEVEITRYFEDLWEFDIADDVAARFI